MNILTAFFQLRSDYKTVVTLKSLSGFTWDDTLGLNIGAQTDQAYKVLEKVSSIDLDDLPA